MRTKFAAILVASAALSGCVAVTTPSAATKCAATQTQCLNQWFDAKFEEELSFSPLRQTALGRKTDYDKIDDRSVAAVRRQIAWWQQSVAEMEANFDYDEMSDDAKLSFDMFKFRAAQAESSAKFFEQQFVFEQMDGAHTDIPTRVLSLHSVDNESEMQAFITRLGGIGTAMDQSLVKAKANAAAGVRPPRFAYNFVIDESRRLVTGAPFDQGEPSALWEGTLTRLAKLVEKGTITQARSDELQEQARTTLIGKTGPAYQRIIDWMTLDRPNSDEVAIGVSGLPNGSAYYAYMLAQMTTTNLTADEIHALGLSEVARLRGEMEAIKNRIGYKGTLQKFFEFIRKDERFFFTNDDAGAQAYIDRATMHIDKLSARLPKFFGHLPKARLEVRRVQPFREQDGAAQHYQVGTPDGSRPGVYYAHLSDMGAMPIPVLETIAYHEGNPGHHMQFSIAQELEGVPLFRAQGEYIPAYGEGWGLYSEALAKEMGGFEDPYSDFGRLQNEIWRAIRLVVDTGIHSKGWTEDQAVAYCLENAPLPETTARAEVRRYFVLPGQATSYKIGMIRIQKLRAKAEAELGDDFDIRGFHDAVLGGGQVPLSILERQVDNWIASVKAS